MSEQAERLPPPSDPAMFESLCLELFKAIWNDSGAQKNAGVGQPQGGVDIVGQQRGRWIGVQCRINRGARTESTVRQLDEEVERAKTFKPALSEFIFATTAAREARLQQRARELTTEHRDKGLFQVQVWSWDEVWHELYSREDLLKRILPIYWPRLLSSTPRIGPRTASCATPKVFISYSHKDESWKRMIKSHLSKFDSPERFALWDDSEIAPGADWAKELERQRSEASAVLMLISAGYLASQSVREEVRHLLEQRDSRGLHLIPILISPCDWQNVDWLRRIQIYPEKASPLSNMSAEDQRAALSRFAEVFMSLLGITASEVASQQVSSAKQDRRLVILVHGIRTRAEWQGRLKHLFEADGQTIVEPVGYEYFDVFRFLCPLWTRRKPVRVVLRKIRAALSLHDHKYDEFIIVAHSFGTFVVGRILADEFDIRPDRLLLCGCIQPSSFAWERLPNRPRLILNEAGSRDIWPILAESITWGYGSTGTFGFQTPGVRDRYHDLAHSDYFKPGFAEEYWVPWIREGITKTTPFETGPRPATPFSKNLFEFLPLRWILVAIVGLAAYLLRHEILALTTGSP